MNKKIWTLSLCAIFGARLCADNMVSLSTDSTNKSSRDVIKLENAYNENPNINGSGIEIGILDSGFNENHPSLKDKNLDLVNNKNWNQTSNTHGSHVAGIILGNNLGPNSPKGIASNAKYYGVAILNPNPNQQFNADTNNLFEYFKDKKNVKIINNSWGGNAYPIINKKFNGKYENFAGTGNSIDSRNYFNYITKYDKITDQLYQLSKQNKVLNVFSSGNEGIISPSVNAVVPSYDESVRSWLVVGAINANDFTNGTLQANKQGIASFSNIFKGAENYALVAPGVDIYAANADYPNRNDKFIPKDGTSMAAPMVSGVAALVQQKYPFLNGAQIADVLLTTANNTFDAPKIAVLESSIKDKKDKKYTIIYIGKEIPKNGGNSIDIAQVKADLKAIGKNTDKIMDNLLLVQGETDKSKAIIKLSKGEVFGQGILDAQKALKGLAELDANRLNTEDIQEFEKEKYAFYTINQDLNGEYEFSNDISQKKWDDKLHRDDAKELPAEMKTIQKIGFKKVGSGKLTLSGSNSYEGPTIVDNGILELKGGNQKANLTQSDAYALNKGTLLLNDAILNKNATVNQGIIQINSKAEVKGNTTIKNKGSLILSTNANEAGTLTTKKVELREGGILEGAGTISGDVINISGLVLAGFNQNDKAVSDKNILNITQKYEHQKDAKLRILFDNQGNNKNSQIKAGSFAIKGGNLEFKPTYNGENTRLKDGDVIPLILEQNLKSELSKFTKVEIVESNTLKFTFDKSQGNLTFHSDMKEDAFIPQDNSGNKGNSSLGGVLQNLSKQDLPKEYDEFFGKIDSHLSKKEFNEVVTSIDDKSHLIGVKDAMNFHNRVELNSLSYLTSTIPNFANNQKSEYFASIDSPLNDAILYENLRSFDDLGKTFLFNTSFTRLNNDDYHANTYAFDLQGKKRILGDSLLVGYLGYARTDTTHKYADGKSHQFSLGLQNSFNIQDKFYLYSGVGFGIGLNDNTKRIAHSSISSNSDYNTYIGSLQLGVGKDFKIASNVTLKPVVMANYSLAYQEDFKESSSLFSRKIPSSTYDSYGASLGGNLEYTKAIHSDLKAYFSTFGFYTYKRYGNFDNTASFSDFSNTRFNQELSQKDRKSFYMGLVTELLYKNFFARVGFSSDISSKEYSLNGSFSAGINF